MTSTPLSDKDLTQQLLRQTDDRLWQLNDKIGADELQLIGTQIQNAQALIDAGHYDQAQIAIGALKTLIAKYEAQPVPQPTAPSANPTPPPAAPTGTPAPAHPTAPQPPASPATPPAPANDVLNRIESKLDAMSGLPARVDAQDGLLADLRRDVTVLQDKAGVTTGTKWYKRLIAPRS